MSAHWFAPHAVHSCTKVRLALCNRRRARVPGGRPVGAKQGATANLNHARGIEVSISRSPHSSRFAPDNSKKEGCGVYGGLRCAQKVIPFN
jgi:hypothetical protein